MPEYAGFDFAHGLNLQEGFSCGQAMVRKMASLGFKTCKDNDGNSHEISCSIRDDHCFCRFALGGTGRDIGEYPFIAKHSGRQFTMEIKPGRISVRCQVNAKEYLQPRLEDLVKNYALLLRLRETRWTTPMKIYSSFLPIPAEYTDREGKLIMVETAMREESGGILPEQAAMLAQVIAGIGEVMAGDPIFRYHVTMLLTNAFDYRMSRAEMRELRRAAKEVVREKKAREAAERAAREAVHFGSDAEENSDVITEDFDIDDGDSDDDDDFFGSLGIHSRPPRQSSSSASSSSGPVGGGYPIPKSAVKKEKKKKKEEKSR